MKVFLDSLGCRLNQAELEQMAAAARAAGHQPVGTPEQAELALINTCTVTARAAADSRQRVRAMARHNPDRKSVV